MNSSQEFARLVAGVRELQGRGFAGGAALATLIGIDGAAFRRPGARMLVWGDGCQIRGLSVGCAESDLITQARHVITAEHATVVTYDREQSLDLLLEIGCGAALHTLIEPLNADSDLNWIDATAGLLRSRREGVLATVYAHDDQCLDKPRRLLWSDDVLLDELACPELSDALVPMLRTTKPQSAAVSLNLNADNSNWQVFIEAVSPPQQLVVIGDSPTARALSALAAQLGWVGAQVTSREVEAQGATLPCVVSQTGLPPGDVVLDRYTAVVVMTHNLQRDIDVLTSLSGAPLAYLGAIGSRARSAKLREATGLGVEQLHAPAGLDIRAETPEEIALAIAAEIQTGFAGGDGQPLHLNERALH